MIFYCICMYMCIYTHITYICIHTIFIHLSIVGQLSGFQILAIVVLQQTQHIYTYIYMNIYIFIQVNDFYKWNHRVMWKFDYKSVLCYQLNRTQKNMRSLLLHSNSSIAMVPLWHALLHLYLLIVSTPTPSYLKGWIMPPWHLDPLPSVWCLTYDRSRRWHIKNKKTSHAHVLKHCLKGYFA